MSAPPDTTVMEGAPKTDAEVAKPEPEPTNTTTTIDAPAAEAHSTAAAPATGAPAPTEAPAPAAAPVALAVTPTLAAEPAAPPRERELVVDARLGVLRAMFPDFDDSLLQSVLDSVQGDTDRAIDALLGMSDPDYQGEHVPQQARPQTQEELDEQLARTLMLEDERSAHAWRVQQPPPQQQRPEARRQGSTGAPEKDTMQEFQEQFNKFAESGKKTLGTLFSKVKAKIQEFDQPAGQSSSGANATYGGVGGDTYPYEANQHPYPARQQQAQAQAQSQAQAQMPAYYDPNAGDVDASPPGSASAGYDVGAPREMGAGATPGPPSTQSGAPPIDGGKLGMLPKRPVSLLRTNSPPSATTGAPPSSDDDDLEYAENPFEEGKK
ncbi:CUE domain-containing protein [Mycena venus]|uniref:CUE domain-containing protein n=1 Tax=Mycena venus TaxID=2733690 RepID=A0A8H6YB59_9AGAR|nr:CUE domain-containing protein [Mycena venus]